MTEKKRRILLSLFFVILLAALLFVQHLLSDEEGLVTLSSGYDVNFRGETMHNTDWSGVREISAGQALAGETVTISHLLPEVFEPGTEDPAAFPAVLLETGLSSIRVLADDTPLYLSEEPDLRNAAADVPATHIVPLPADSAGQLLTIQLTGATDGAKGFLKPVTAGTQDALHKNYNKNGIVAFGAGVSMTFFAFVSLLLMAVFFLRLRRIETRMAAAVVTADIGLFMALSTGLQKQVTGESFATIRCVLLFVFVPLLSLYLSRAGMKEKTKKKRLLSGGGILLSLMCLFLYLTDSLSLRILLPLYLLPLAYFSFRIGKDTFVQVFAKKVQTEQTLLSLSVTALCLVPCFDTIASILQMFFGLEKSGINRYAFAAAAALFFTAQTFHDITFLRESVLKHDENTVLYKVAYEDALTGLNNRTSWDEKISEVDASDHGWCIISMDLDGLKGINDTKGHAAGDKLISGFARVLEEAFGRKYFLSRIGGDEFCVIMEDVDEEEVKRCLERLEARLKAWDKREKNVTHHCSYGYAFFVPGEKDAHATYLEADMTMYEMKSKHKAAKKATAMVQSYSADAKVAQIVEETLSQMRDEEVAAGKASTLSATQALLHVAGKSFADGAVSGDDGKERSYEGAPVRPRKLSALEQRKQTEKLMEQKHQIQQPQKAGAENPVESIQKAEINKVAKDVAVKKAMKTIEEAMQQAGGNE
ncbi:MAG: GGDEF domain-containing protein [Lachnospiraceae bacterium]|nr:GGDEF domain-containing protein [Lachnospiraceae bacterium]